MHEPVTLSGNGLWIQFVWRGDRWGHRIGVASDTTDPHQEPSVVGLSEADPPVADLNEIGIAGLSEVGLLPPLPPGEGRGEGAPLNRAAPPSDSPRSLTSATDEDRGQRPRLQTSVILESVEGTPEQNWPPSPPLQELHLESRPDGKQLALLVGMAGTSHWSMSVEFDPLARRAIFDVACRVKRPPDKLGNSYQRRNSQEYIAPTVDRIAPPMTVRWSYVIQPIDGAEPPELAVEIRPGSEMKISRHLE